jgi:hypothetical protein
MTKTLILVAIILGAGLTGVATANDDSPPNPNAGLPTCVNEGGGKHYCVQDQGTTCVGNSEGIKVTMATSKKCWLYVRDPATNTAFYHLKLEDWALTPSAHSQCDGVALGANVTRYHAPPSIRFFECTTNPTVPSAMSAQFNTGQAFCQTVTASLQRSRPARGPTQARRPAGRTR